MAKTRDLVGMLARRYSPPEWAFLPQVRDAAGFAASRTADAIAMNLWPSRGLEIHGFEVKASRGDWLRELKDPSKSEAVQGYCDRWWVVADLNIVMPGELPPTWGLLLPRGAGLGVEVEAPKLEASQPDKSFLAVLLRKTTQGMIAVASIEDRIEQARQDGLSAARSSLEDSHRQSDSLRESIAKFETASGVRIEAWSGERIGRAVRFVLEHGVERFRMEVEQRQRWAQQIADECAAKLAELAQDRTHVQPHERQGER